MFNYDEVFKTLFNNFGSPVSTSSDYENTDTVICSGVKEIGDNMYRDGDYIYITESCLQQNSIKVVENKIDGSLKDYMITITGLKAYPFIGEKVYKIKCSKITADSFEYKDGVIVIKTKPRKLNAK